MKTINNKKQFVEWWESKGNYLKNLNDREELLNRLPSNVIIKKTQTTIKILFPRCKYYVYAIFDKNECYHTIY